jgi:archaellum component FlaC
MLNAPLVENNMFNTLAFSKKMQNVGMTQEVAEELASTLFNLHLNQFENLLTKKEFSRFEGEIKKEIDGVKHEIDGVKHEIDGVKKEIDGVKNEMKNFVTKKEFYAETKNLSLNLTIKMGIIMTAGIGVLSLLLKL